MARDLHIAAMYTKYLRFDDVYMGLLMHKLLVVPVHLSTVFSFRRAHKYQEKAMISSHGFKKPLDIFDTWINVDGFSFCVTD